MNSKKLSLANIEGQLSRNEMKNIMAGCGSGGGSYKCCWSGTTNCSACVSHGGSCVSGAVLVSC